MTQIGRSYVRLMGMLVLVAVVSFFLSPLLAAHVGTGSEAALLTAFFDIAAIFAASFVAFYASHGTKIPSFVIAILVGMAAKPLLQGIVSSEAVLSVVVGLGATLMLFGGGLETPFQQFKRSIGRILALSLPGMVLTALLFSLIVGLLGFIVHVPILATSAILLGAILASTDPAAIIPLLKGLRFKNESTRTIIISESAVTDAVGALLTVTFLSLILSGIPIESILSGYGSLFSLQSVGLLLQQVGVGVLFGILGFFLMEALVRFKCRGEEKLCEFEADTAFFLFVPIVIFVASLAFGGSGYLAAFIAGLLFNIKEELHQSDQFFNRSIDGFLKPAVFLLLGALVDVQTLIHFAPIGILAAVAFIVIVRPLTVFATLGPFALLGKKRASFKDLLFISFVRETGAVPAVLLITIASLALPQTDMIVAIGMWVILLTLIIEPPLTPWIAQKLGVAEPISPNDVAVITKTGDPFVVLGTRGYSFGRRLPQVVDWATKHGIARVVILLCLENRYSSSLVAKLKKEAAKLAKEIDADMQSKHQPAVTIELVANKGFLQENIDHLAETEKDLAVIFIGKRVLDFRLTEIKQLPVPFYFLD